MEVSKERQELEKRIEELERKTTALETLLQEQDIENIIRQFKEAKVLIHITRSVSGRESIKIYPYNQKEVKELIGGSFRDY